MERSEMLENIKTYTYSEKEQQMLATCLMIFCSLISKDIGNVTTGIELIANRYTKEEVRALVRRMAREIDPDVKLTLWENENGAN